MPALIMLAMLLFADPIHAAAPASRGFDVIGYTVNLIPDETTGTLEGRESIELTVTHPALTHVQFDVGGLTIDAVSLRGKPAEFNVSDKQLRIALRTPVNAGKRLTFTVEFHGRPRHGLEFHAEAAQLYTIFSTSEWMVTVDAPDERATLDLSVVIPESANVATGNGPIVSRKRVEGDRVVVRWRQRMPIPSFAYGFAAGRSLTRWRKRPTGIPFEIPLTGFDEGKRSRQLFGKHLRRNARILRSAFRCSLSRQVLPGAGNGNDRPGSGHRSRCCPKRTAARRWRARRTEDLIAHEIAHQWWAVSIYLSHSWGEFWLNEGMANFMAAAWMQHKHGDAEYLVAVNRWRTRLEKLKADGKDHALVYERWDKPTRDDRAVVYQKGAYVLHLLRQEMGEVAFWNGIRLLFAGVFQPLGEHTRLPARHGASERTQPRPILQSLGHCLGRWARRLTGNEMVAFEICWE